MKFFTVGMTTDQTRELIETIEYRLRNDKTQSFESVAYLQRIQQKILLAMREQAKKDKLAQEQVAKLAKEILATAKS